MVLLTIGDWSAFISALSAVFTGGVACWALFKKNHELVEVSKSLNTQNKILTDSLIFQRGLTIPQFSIENQRIVKDTWGFHVNLSIKNSGGAFSLANFSSLTVKSTPRGAETVVTLPADRFIKANSNFTLNFHFHKKGEDVISAIGEIELCYFYLQNQYLATIEFTVDSRSSGITAKINNQMMVHNPLA